MKRIEPVAWMCEYVEDGEVEREYNGHNQFSCGRFGNPLYTDDALQTVAEAILSKLQDEINKHIILDEYNRFDVMFNRGLDKADAIVGDFDVIDFLKQLKGQ